MAASCRWAQRRTQQAGPDAQPGVDGSRKSAVPVERPVGGQARVRGVVHILCRMRRCDVDSKRKGALEPPPLQQPQPGHFSEKAKGKAQLPPTSCAVNLDVLGVGALMMPSACAQRPSGLGEQGPGPSRCLSAGAPPGCGLIRGVPSPPLALGFFSMRSVEPIMAQIIKWNAVICYVNVSNCI